MAFAASSDLNSSTESAVAQDDDRRIIVPENKEHDVVELQYRRPAYVAVGLIMFMTLLAVFFPMLVASISCTSTFKNCSDSCSISLVESIPENLTYIAGSPEHLTTYFAWLGLIQKANVSIDIAALYWSLRGQDIYADPSDWQGEAIYSALLDAGKNRHVKLRFAQNIASMGQPNLDTLDLETHAGAQVRSLNFSQWYGGGVLHTKLWIFDQTHMYLGSANMDWRSLTQVKEMGVIIQNCPCLVKDVQKIFDAYWVMGEKMNIPLPKHWPAYYETKYNDHTPARLLLNQLPSNVYFSSSPPEFCAAGRTGDIDSILAAVERAQKFVHIAVMDYFPMSLYKSKNSFWPLLDDALRKAAIERHIEVKLLASNWTHTRSEMYQFLKSLSALDGAHNASIQVKLFHVPADERQSKIPFARVNHNKYMVTDNTAYIGTSNWSEDYFTVTGGIGLIVTSNATSESQKGSKTLRQQLSEVFLRDWNSEYAFNISQSSSSPKHHNFVRK